MRRAAAILPLALLGACASLSEAECLAGDWRAIGFEDGAEGRPLSRIGEHREACARHGVAPDLDLWRIGYEEGLPSYCTRANGFRVGATGATYYGVCDGRPGAAAFQKALGDGATLHAVNQDLDAARTDLYRVEHEIDRLVDRREGARADAERQGISDEQRREYLDEVERLSEDIGRLDGEHDDIEYAVDRIERDMRDVESRMRIAYPEWRGY